MGRSPGHRMRPRGDPAAPVGPRPGLTLRAAIPPYLEDSRGRRTPATIPGYRNILFAAAREPWALVNLGRLDHRPIQAWIGAHRARGVSGATLNRMLTTLSSLFRWALREDLIEANPIARIPKFSERGRERETYLSDAEARSLVAAAPADFQAFLVCALATGMRKGELQRLTWGSVDLARRFLTVESRHSKTGRARTIPLSGWLEEVLFPLLQRGSGPHRETAVFRTGDGRPLNDWQIRKRLDLTLARCDGIPPEKRAKVTLHVMRHTAASLMVAAGVPLFDVAKVLGHTTLSVTMRYAHFAPAAGRAAIDALDRAPRPPQP